MGLLGIGGSKSSANSRTDSFSFDNLDSFGFDFGTDSSRSRSGSFGRSRDSLANADVFADLFSGASASAAGIDTGGITSAANQLFSSGGGFLDTLRGGGAGAEFMQNRLASDSGLADQQIGALGSDIGTFLNETVNPAITARGVAASTLGGSRTGVARGVAGGKAVDAFSKGAVDIRAREQAARDAIAGNLATNEAGRSTAGLGSLAGLFGLAESGAMADLSPFAALSSILGQQTVLGESDSGSSALADSFGLNFGTSSTTGRAGSESHSRSKSTGKSFNFGFGGK